MRAGAIGLWLLLLSILTHAAVPTDLPLGRASETAFSASTTDVSLAPVRSEADADEAAILAAPALPSAPQFAHAAEANAFPRPADGGAASFRARAPPFSLI